jgi:endonuclease/exonuclease/phosphatase family metal-dependent hydrolase
MAGCHTSAAKTSSLDVRVMTFNVKQHNPRSQQSKDAPTHWDRRKDMVFDILRDYSPEVLGLQEPYRSQLDDIRKAFPQFDEVGEGRDGGSRGEHSSILYRADRFRVDASGTFWLSDTPEKKSKTWGHFYLRICTWARLVERKSGRAFYVFNTHLDHQSQVAREKSVRLIAQRIDQREHKDPFILAGDFNAGEGNPVVAYLKGKHKVISPVPVVDSFRVLHPNRKIVGTGNRFEGRVDGEKIDYIFVPSDAEVLEASIIRTHREGRYPSDHFPVTATIRFHIPS